jgi:hypothetical protein
MARTLRHAVSRKEEKRKKNGELLTRKQVGKIILGSASGLCLEEPCWLYFPLLAVQPRSPGHHSADMQSILQLHSCSLHGSSSVKDDNDDIVRCMPLSSEQRLGFDKSVPGGA